MRRTGKMKVCTVSEARQKLATLLEQASREGMVQISREDGQIFIVPPETRVGSPLDVEGLDFDVTPVENVEIVREGRRSHKPNGVQ